MSAPGEQPFRDDRGEPTDADPKTQQKAEEEETLDAAATHEVVRREAQKELDRAPIGLAWSGLAAGLSMGFSLAAEGVLRSMLPDAPWRPLVAKLGYAVGFLIVILGSQQLFTENTLEPMVPLLSRPSMQRVQRMLRLWAVVLATNLAGTIVFAFVAARTAAFRPEVRDAFLAIAHESMTGSFGNVFLRALFAGWLIALLVWMLPAAQSARVLVIIIMTWLVGVGGFSHVVVGSVEMSYLLFTGSAPVADYFTRFLFPTLLGNIAGGVSLVAVLNHKQATAGSA